MTKNYQPSLFADYDEDVQKCDMNRKKDKRPCKQAPKHFGMEYCYNATFSGKYGIPLIKPFHDPLPLQYTTFSNINSEGNPNCCVTFFDNDSVLERIWNNPEKYLDKLSKYMCVGEPDFSLRINHPLAVQIANIHRSHAISYMLQENGIPVVTCPSWSTTRSFEFCFDGHSKGGAVIVSTIGTLKNECAKKYFQLGFNEMLKRLSPDSVVLYGDINDELYSWMPKQLDVHHVNHKRYERARNHGR